MDIREITLTNSDILKLVHEMHLNIKKWFGETSLNIYGIPRGGIPVTYLLNMYSNISIVDDPKEADVFIDDIISSGATRDRWKGIKNIPFFALISKPEPGVWYIFPWEDTLLASAEDVPLRFLEFIGEDYKRDGLINSPERVVRSWKELYSGYSIDPKSVITQFDNEEHYDQMVLLKDIEFYSTCEHHFLPFFGKVHIAYIPKDKVLGISKLSRIVDCFARRLQVQERLTMQIANFIQDELNPLGVGVIIKAQHLCMIARGVKQHEAMMVTSALKGEFKDNAITRNEFLSILK